MIGNAKGFNATNAEPSLKSRNLQRRDDVMIAQPAPVISKITILSQSFFSPLCSVDYVATLNVAHRPTHQTWKIELCAADFENFRCWLASLRYRRSRETMEREAA